jgi:hypothetical protein
MRLSDCIGAAFQTCRIADFQIAEGETQWELVTKSRFDAG